MNGITEIKQRVRSSQPFSQFSFSQAEAAHTAEILIIAGSGLVEETVILAQPMHSQLRREASDCRQIGVLVTAGGKNFQPDRIELQSF